MSHNYEFDHAVGADLDYGFNWQVKGWLAAGETVVTSTWNIPAGLVSRAPSNTGTITTIFVSGATVNTSYKFTNTITTSLGRVDNRSIVINCKQR